MEALFQLRARRRRGLLLQAAIVTLLMTGHSALRPAGAAEAQQRGSDPPRIGNAIAVHGGVGDVCALVEGPEPLPPPLPAPDESGAGSVPQPPSPTVPDGAIPGSDPTAKEAPPFPQNPQGSRPKGAFPHASRFDLDELERQGVRISAIRIECLDIFDPSVSGENRKLYRWINKLHVTTRQRTIHHQLLFAEGEPLVKSRLEETERNIRALPFVQDASVEVDAIDEGGATILVRTMDVWSTRVSIRFGSAGGKGTGGFSLAERNLLGFGKGLQLKYFQGIDRTTTQLLYADPNLFGSKLDLRLDHITASDGGGDSVLLQRPFLSFEDPRAWTAGAARLSEEVPIYRQGEIVQSFNHDGREASGTFSWARPLDSSSSNVERWTAGYVWDESTYSPIGPLSAAIAPDEVPESGTVSGPIVKWSRMRRDFLKTRNFERFSRWEDYNLGGSITVGLQPSLKDLGATYNELLFTAVLSKGFRTWRESVLLSNLNLFGRVGIHNRGFAHVDFIHYYTGWRGQTFVVRAAADASVNADAQSYFYLGGETGLRGFELRTFDGTRKFLINFEDRIRIDGEILHLLRLGVAPFIDVGNAWGGTQSEQVCTPGKTGTVCRYVTVDNNFGNLKADIGISLLADVVKASSAGFLRLNIAFPIDGAKYNQGRYLISFGQQVGF